MRKKLHPTANPHQSDHQEESAARRRATRRRLLAGGTAAGAVAALGSEWTRPVVQSVLLPAHAQLSPGTEPGVFRLELEGLDTGNAGEWLDWIAPSAHAGVPTPIEECDLVGACAELADGELAFFILFTDGPNACFQGSGPLGNALSLSLVSGGPLKCNLPEVTPLGLDGTAPDRLLTVAVGGNVRQFQEVEGDCNCSSFII